MFIWVLLWRVKGLIVDKADEIIINDLLVYLLHCEVSLFTCSSLDTGGNHSPPLSLATNRPMCHCGIRMAWSRSRLSMLSNSHRNTLLWKAVKKVNIHV